MSTLYKGREKLTYSCAIFKLKKKRMLGGKITFISMCEQKQDKPICIFINQLDTRKKIT